MREKPTPEDWPFPRNEFVPASRLVEDTSSQWGVSYVCDKCGVQIVEPDPPRMDLCPVCRTGGDPTNYPPLNVERGDFR